MVLSSRMYAAASPAHWSATAAPGAHRAPDCRFRHAPRFAPWRSIPLFPDTTSGTTGPAGCVDPATTKGGDA